MRRLALPALLAGIVVVAAAVADWPEPPPSAASASSATTATPVLSPRRVPGILAETVAEARLRAGVELALLDPALGRAPNSSCVAVDVGHRQVLGVRADQPVLPASNLKLLTAAAALRVLGPDTRLTTEVRGAVAFGGVAGDLWLVGGGDPLLATGDYAATLKRPPQPFTPVEELARRIRAAGVTQVVGRVLGDESRYDGQRYVPSWKPGYIDDNEIGPMSALTVNDGFSAFQPKKVPAAQPATNAASVLTAVLRNAGVTVVGVPGEGRAPAGLPVIARLESLPVKDLVAEMLRESDNLTAELLTKEIGRKVSGSGTTSAGVAAIRATLARMKLPLAGLALVDGSGLDRTDRATCRLLLELLQQAGPLSPLVAGLPVAHGTGTLADRFGLNPAAGRLRAKTGSLNGVSALSGIVPGRKPETPTITFSLVLNGLPRDSLGPTTWERVGAVLGRYPDAPEPASLAPR